MEETNLALFLKPKILKQAAESADQITRRLAINKVGRMIAAAHQDCSIRMYDVQNGEEVQRLKDNFLCTSLAFSPRGDIIASGGVDRVLKLWDIKSGECFAQLTGHSYPVLSIAFAPNGDRLVTSSGDTTLIVWDVDNRKQLRQLRGHSLYVVSCDWDPNGERIVSGGVDAMIGIWNPDTGERIQWIREHRAAVHTVRFSRDGSRLASGSSDMSIIVWDVTDGGLRCTNTLRRHTEEVRTVAFSSDGKLLASGSSDKHLLVWSTEDYSLLGEGLTQTEVDGIEWLQEGHILLTCEGSGAIIRWNIMHMETMLEPFRALLGEIQSDIGLTHREEHIKKFEQLRDQYDPEVLQDKRVFYIMWQCKKALGLLKGKSVGT